MKSKTLLDSAVFQLTPTRTRCDLYIIANDKREKIASGLLNPFIAHLKTAQDQIAEGGYSILLAPEAGSNATWFTKCTVESFVRFVSTPEILERVYTIESEILQIEEAISIQGNNEILIEDQHIKPVAGGEGSKPAYDDDEEKAIVLYKPGAPELTGSSANEKNSKVQLLNVLETRKTVLKKEQGMAFARAVAAGFVIEHVSNLLSFAKCFGASRLMSACLRFMDLWKQKHESGQWVEIEAEDAMCSKSDYSPMNNASEIVLSTMTNRHDEPGGDAVSETKETPGSDPNASGGQQQYNSGRFLHPGFPPWAMHSSPSGAVPVYHQAYPMPYYQHYPSSAPFYPPPAAALPMDYRYPDPESNEETSEHKNAGKSKSGRVVIRNINFINSKTKQKSSSGDESDTGDEIESHNILPKRNGNVKESESEGLNGKETDGGHWDAFQTYLLKVAAEGERSDKEDMFSMEKDHNKKARRKSLTVDPLVAHHVGHDDDDGEEHRIGLQSYDRNGRKIVYRSGNDDLKVCRAEEQKAADVRNPLVNSGFEGRSGLRNATDDEAAMVSLRSTSGVNESTSGGLNMGCYDLPSQNPEKCFSNERLKYEPDALSLMPERDLEKRHMHIGGYDPALEYETQLACGKAQHKKGPKSAEKHQQSKGVGPPIIRKGKPSKVNNILEDARARADKLRSYKADLQKMKKQQQEAEHKRLEALKMERQKRIAARTNSNSNSSSSKKQLPSKQHSPISYKNGSKFSDSEPGTSSPLQRSKIKPTSITNTKKPSTHSRLTKSMSSISDTKKDINSVTPDSKSARITRPSQSQPKKINNNDTATTTTHTTKTRSAVSKPKSFNVTKNKSSAIIDVHQSKSATLPELKIFRTSSNPTQKVKADKSVSQVAKQSLNERSLHPSDTDDFPIIDKSVVMLQHKQQSIVSANAAATLTNINHGPGGAYIHEVSLPMEIVDKGTISVQPLQHPTTYELGQEQVKKNSVAENTGTSSSDQAPYASVSSFEDPSTRNSEYAKAPRSNSGLGTEKAYISDFNNFKLEKIPEILQKPQPTGFRRLLKLGKKSHTHSDTSTGNASQPDTAHLSAQVHTLKTLISEDQTSQKPSRHFSLLSTFRGKTTEKKPTTFGS